MMLSDPKRAEQEQRRLTLRREMFGADDRLDLKPGGGVTAEGKAVIERLDRGRLPAAGSGMSPLKLLYLGMGWGG